MYSRVCRQLHDSSPEENGPKGFRATTRFCFLSFSFFFFFTAYIYIMDLPRSEIGSVHGCAPIVGYPCPDPFALFVRLSVTVVADVRGNVRKGEEEKKNRIALSTLR